MRGGIFQLIANDSKQDRMLSTVKMLKEKLRKKANEIKLNESIELLNIRNALREHNVCHRDSFYDIKKYLIEDTSYTRDVEQYMITSENPPEYYDENTQFSTPKKKKSVLLTNEYLKQFEAIGYSQNR